MKSQKDSRIQSPHKEKQNQLQNKEGKKRLFHFFFPSLNVLYYLMERSKGVMIKDTQKIGKQDSNQIKLIKINFY